MLQFLSSIAVVPYKRFDLQRVNDEIKTEYPSTYSHKYEFILNKDPGRGPRLVFDENYLKVPHYAGNHKNGSDEKIVAVKAFSNLR